MAKKEKIIIYEDSKIIVVNKPAGVLSQKDKNGDEDIKEYLHKNSLFEKTKFLSPVHRLDRNVSGLMILAKDSESAKVLSKNIKDLKVSRKYRALVKGKTETSGTLDYPLLKDNLKNRSIISSDGKKAITDFVTIQHYDSFSLLEVSLSTGRSHQIRCHFSHIGHPVIGDRKYGKKPWSALLDRLALYSYFLEFSHPVTRKKMEFSLDTPLAIKDLLNDISS